MLLQMPFHDAPKVTMYPLNQHHLLCARPSRSPCPLCSGGILVGGIFKVVLMDMLPELCVRYMRDGIGEEEMHGLVYLVLGGFDAFGFGF